MLYRLASSDFEASGMTGASVSLLITGPPNTFLYAFGGRDWFPLFTGGSSGVYACTVSRSIPGFNLPTGSYDAPVSTCGVLGTATTTDDTDFGAIVEEPARPPNGANVALSFPSSVGGTTASPTSVIATRLAAVSRFRASAAWSKPTFACAIQAFPSGTGGSPSWTEAILTSHYSDDDSLGLFGLVTLAAGTTESLPTAGLAAGTMHGAASRFATANLERRQVSIFELVRTTTPETGPSAPPFTTQHVEKRLVTSFIAGAHAAEGEWTLMISPSAASQDCGSIAVCFGTLQRLRGASTNFPPLPVLNQVLTFGAVSVDSAGEPTYDEVALPLSVPQGLAILEAGLSSYGNVLSVVSANADDYITDLGLTLYIELPRGAPAAAPTTPPVAQREWIPAQHISLSSPTLLHPMVAYALAPSTGGGLNGETPSFFGFSYSGMSDSVLAFTVLTELTPVKASADVYTYAHHEPPSPPASLKFQPPHAAASMPALYNRVLSQLESVYVKEYAAWLTSQTRGGAEAGRWKLAKSAYMSYGVIPIGGVMAFTAPTVSDDARFSTLQFATNMDFSSATLGASLDQVLPKNFFRIGDSEPEATEIEFAEAFGGRRGPPAVVTASTVGTAALDPGGALLKRFQYLV